MDGSGNGGDVNTGDDMVMMMEVMMDTDPMMMDSGGNPNLDPPADPWNGTWTPWICIAFETYALKLLLISY